jgi:signal transduction histidine kinase
MDVATVVKRSPFVFPLACIAAAAMVLISEGAYWQSAQKIDDLGKMRAAREEIQNLENTLREAESGQRGYLLTSLPDYLQPYQSGLKSIDTAFDTLNRHYHDVPAMSAVLRELRVTTDAKLSEMALTIRLHDQGKSGTAIEIMRSNIGKEQMATFSAVTDKLQAFEAATAADSRAALYNTLLLGRCAIAALTALSLLALYLVQRQAARHELHELALSRVMEVERDRLDTEVKQRTAQLTELTQHLQTAREDERNRLARNLHDELGALLTAAKLDAARIKSRLAGTAPEALERLAHLVETLNSSIALGRRIIEDLRPSTLANLGLVPTLEILAREFTERSGLPVHCDLTPVTLDAKTELVIYRLVQEAITNISKYAQASQVWISMSPHGESVEVSVRDDGVGFDSSVLPSSTFGLLGMRFRVEAEGGTLALRSTPGHGARIEVRLPRAAPGAG